MNKRLIIFMAASPLVLCIPVATASFISLSHKVAANVAISAILIMHVIEYWRLSYDEPSRIPSKVITFGLLAIIALSTFGHHGGMIDNSPFSDGIGAEPQIIIGLTGYLRVFDNPDGQFGWVYIDWPAFFFLFYIVTYLTSGTLALICWIKSGYKQIRPTR